MKVRKGRLEGRREKKRRGKARERLRLIGEEEEREREIVFTKAKHVLDS